MTTKPVSEIDDELFDEVYGKAYTGPPGPTTSNTHENANSNNKRPQEVDDANGESEEEGPQDPNAVPTDFTSREAKAWMAKAKATERNWKKRKEEEMICKLCGESGHFTQGCPSTLGANRRNSDFFQRVPARDKHVRALFTGKVLHRIERENDCKIKMDEKFIIVSSKNQLSMTKGVDAVHQLMQDDKSKGPSSHHRKSTSPDGSPDRSQFRRSDSQRAHPSPRKASQAVSRKQEKIVEDHLREDLHKLSKRSPQARAYGHDGARGQSSHSKSPPRSTFPGNTYNTYDGHSQKVGMRKIDGWDGPRHVSDVLSSGKYEFHAYPQSLEELEMEFKREGMEIGRIRDKEEDEENYKHREAIREMRETYMKKLALMRGMHAKHWEEFLQDQIQKRQRAQQHMSESNYNSYNLSNYLNIDRASSNPRYAENNLPIDLSKYPYAVENYSNLRPQNDPYGEFQRQKHEEYGKGYNRY